MLNYDGTIDIATGHGAKSKTWKNQKTLWSQFVERLKKPVVTAESLKEFLAASKDDQMKIKDVGGYVGAYLRKGQRHPKNVVHRQLLTLDIDFAKLDFWENFTLIFNCAAVLHSTHKHSPENPRLRLVIPVNRELTAEEYPAVSRYIAGVMGIEAFDNTTFEVNRLMFWPSISKDSTYYFEVQDGPWLNADNILKTYPDWRDSSLWPTTDKKLEEVRSLSKKQEDPETKKGIIGAFCRSYSITEAIETFLSDVYEPTALTDRYTYLNGSTAAGLIVYDEKFAYSHHGTDPCSGKLCNAFDLVRVHKFGHLETGSQKAMEDFARADKLVKKTIAAETIDNSKYDFAEPVEEEINTEWAEEMEVDKQGNYLSTAHNIDLILKNDPNLKGRFRQNEFDNKRYVVCSLPWRKVQRPEPIKNVDFSGVRNYIEKVYGISSNLKIEDSLALEFERNSFHPIKDYLKSLKWDGVKRVDYLLTDFFGVECNIYTKEAIRKPLVAAVARVFNPGVKFDLVLTLVGQQGEGKSTFFRNLGRGWFSDSFTTVSGKEAFEQLQGAWLIEMAELSGLKKAEVESVKHFISKQDDTFRPAYGRTPETYPRQCVFFGTTNSKDFLRDPSGNRRFMPVDIDCNKALYSVFSDDMEVDQIWAEAVELFKAGETLYLSAEAEAIARHEQVKHSEVDERHGLIEQFLDKKLPEKWGEMDLIDRRAFMSDPLAPNGSTERKYVCIAEIWCECLGKPKEDMSRYNTREINDIMKHLTGWEASNSTKNFKLYGKQKYYQRK